MITIREESNGDLIAIRKINDKAFGRPQEGRVIDKLRESDSQVLSLVAEIDNNIVGHIFYSTAVIACNNERIVGMGLAPMAVLPAYQKQGIGKLLINESLDVLKKKRVTFIIVLGHEAYYPKFGFEVASKYNIKCQWDDVPNEAFMILILDKEKMSNVHGVAKYSDQWNEAM
ncbi:N-acetyltransferase [Fulvivirgaceae bacterium BMA12]|uniref:N-acetyltransferase n=1 Tax=Agaribacillus aureus TaxID=3051825 RepID=A0ABT8LBD4_9BACT|nr:N-acetyltransferase [Fulvivirgaceae bacterium BMA12]